MGTAGQLQRSLNRAILVVRSRSVGVQRSLAFVLFFPLLLAGTPTAEAQSAQPRLLILHDVPDDGYTYVGNPVHFGYVLLTGEERTTVHKQGHIRVELDGVVLYETDGVDAAHDYDALNTFEIAFPTTGNYTVYAEVPASSGLTVNGTFSGHVVPAPTTPPAKLHALWPAEAVVGTPAIFEFVLQDDQGNNLNHTDVLFEVRRPGDQWLVFRTHAHYHGPPATEHGTMDHHAEALPRIEYAFSSPGTYLIRLTGYQAFPTPEEHAFPPVSVTKEINVLPAPPSSTPSVPMMLPPAKGTSDYVLLTSYDLAKRDGPASPFSRFVLSTLVYDTKTKQLAPHVDFAACLHDATGHQWFYSNSLHEYDGDFDLVLSQLVPGLYTLDVAAIKGEWVGRTTLTVTVAETLPPLLTSAGALIVTAQGLDQLTSGMPQKLHFDAQSLAGTPAMHSEIAFQVVPGGDPWGPPILGNKIHTHESGAFDVFVTFPKGGDYQLVLDPVTIHGEATPHYYFGAIGGELRVPLKVAQGSLLPGDIPPLPQATAPLMGHQLPGVSAWLLIAAVGTLAFMRRRA